MNALEISHLRKTYGNNVAVDDISLEIKPGQFFGFLGPNGAGKSTTIHCITGIGKYSEGSITALGTDVNENYREARKKIGLSPQEFNVDIFSTVESIVNYAGGYYGIPRHERKERIEKLFTDLDLQKHRKKKFQELSGGLKRRVILARALIHDPEILILDEPTAGIDVEFRHELWKQLEKLNKEGKTIILTSHYLEEVEKLCDSIAIINNGKIVKQGVKADFIQNGKTLEETYLAVTKGEHF